MQGDREKSARDPIYEQMERSDEHQGAASIRRPDENRREQEQALLASVFSNGRQARDRVFEDLEKLDRLYEGSAFLSFPTFS